MAHTDPEQEKEIQRVHKLPRAEQLELWEKVTGDANEMLDPRRPIHMLIHIVKDLETRLEMLERGKS